MAQGATDRSDCRRSGCRRGKCSDAHPTQPRRRTRSGGQVSALASVIEAVIGACYLAFGYEETADAVVEAFAPEIDAALETLEA